MKTIKHLIIFLFLYASPSFAAIHSVVFSDVITSKGYGDIDLFSLKANSISMSGNVLEAFRQDNGEKLVFAVDVNESSKGFEKSESQGIAIKSAILTLTINGTDYIYNSYYTNTESILKEIGNPIPQSYYTLIGEAGSNLITPNPLSELNNTSMDALLSFPIDIDLSNVTDAKLEVTLLETDQELTGPESFYDYSNGFEDIALITAEDGNYLTSLNRGVALAPLIIVDEEPALTDWYYLPSSNTFYIVSFEDLYPNRGDYDFNDLVVGYQVAIGQNQQGDIESISGSGYLIARGAEYDHDFYIAIDLPDHAAGKAEVTFNYDSYNAERVVIHSSEQFLGNVNLKLVPNIKDHFFDGSSTYTNTFEQQDIVKGPRFEFTITFDSPLTYDLIADAPFDPYIFVRDTEYEIHTDKHAPRLPFSKNGRADKFRDDIGFPFALILNELWLPPLAGVDMGEAYPNFVEHVKSNGSKSVSWFNSPNNKKIKLIPHKDWRW